MDLHSYTPSELETLISNALKIKNDKELAESFVNQYMALPADVKALVKDLPLFTQAIQPVEIVKPVEPFKVIVVRSRNGAVLRTFNLYADCYRITNRNGDGVENGNYAYDTRRHNPNTLEKHANAMQICASEGWHLRDMQEALYCKKHDTTTCDLSAAALTHYEPTRYYFWFLQEAFMEHAERKGNSIVKKLGEL